MKSILENNNIKCYDSFSGKEFKEQLTINQILYMLDRTNEIFTYKGLPESIPKRNLELITQVTGFSCWCKVKDKLYVFWGGLGGEPNEYYEPTICTVANPYLKFSANLKIGKDCVIMRNDTNFVGLMPMFKKYASLLTENTITMRMTDINMRAPYILSADNDATMESAKEFVSKIIDGDLSVIKDESIVFEGSKVQNTQQSNTAISQLIELEQYLKGSWFNELGIDATFNMKREALNSSETEQMRNSLNTLLMNMLECRQNALEKINEMFGTNITVDFSDAWKKQWEQENSTSEVNSDEKMQTNDQSVDEQRTEEK